MMHNAYGFYPEYNEEVSGTACVCLVKNLPKIYPKRGGAIVYYNEIDKKTEKPEIRGISTKVDDIKLEKKPLNYGFVKILKRDIDGDPLINHKPNLINEEKISFKINDVNKNIINNVVSETKNSNINRIFGFGVDFQYGTFTDFGGGIKYKYDKDAVSAALRELKEESLGLFDFNKQMIQNCCCIYNKDILIIFIPILIKPEICNNYFSTLVKKETKPEVSKLEWISEKDLIEKVQRPYIIYEPVRSLVSKTLPLLINTIM
jgi:hypothetical protein